MPSVTGVWIAVGIVLIVLLLVAMSYNRLVRLRNSTDEAWAQVQVQLKRRFDTQGARKSKSMAKLTSIARPMASTSR